MNAFYTIFAFLLGLGIGSFLNVVAFRYNTGLSFARGRSKCFSCGKTLYWYELVPLASFFIQKGKCRGCGSKLSLQYPVVELLTGIVFAGIFQKFYSEGLSAPILLVVAVYFAVIWSILIVILVYDARHKIIPDGLAFAFAGLVFAKLFITVSAASFSFYIPELSSLLAGPIVALPFFFLWLVSSGRWMGLGDAKLALGIGWLLGIVYGFSAVILAFWIGAAVGLLLILLNTLGKKNRLAHKMIVSLGSPNFILKSEIPFAPFLILGIAIVFFLGIDVTGLSSLL